MIKKIILLPAFCFFWISVIGQELMVQQERTFTGEGLYGFMNGGADLFIEYGAKSLIHRKIVYREEAFTVDVYEMPDKQNAFGIYSMHVFRCQTADSLGSISCLSPYQLLSVVDNYYISIVYPSGSERAKRLACELIPLFISSPTATHLDVPKAFENHKPFSGKLKFFKGPLAVSNVNNPLAEKIKGLPYSGIWYTENHDSNQYRAFFSFSSVDDSQKVKNAFSASSIVDEGSSYLLIEEDLEDSAPDGWGSFGF